MTEGMDGSDRARVIKALAEVAPEQWDRFVSIVNSLTEGMSGYIRASVIKGLGGMAPEQWDNFVSIVNSLTRDIDGNKRAVVICPLIELNSKILFHPEFSKGVTDFLNMIDEHEKTQAILTLAFQRDLFTSKNFSYYALFQKLKKQGTITNNHTVNSLSEIPESTINNPEFWTRASSFITKDMDGTARPFAIEGFGKVAPQEWDNFVSKVNVLTKGMDGYSRARVIKALGRVAPEQWNTFVSRVNDLTEHMFMKLKHHVEAIEGLEKVAPEQWDNFVSIFNGPIKFGYGKYRARAIKALGELDSKILFHPEFSEGVTDFLNIFTPVSATAIHELGKHQDLFASENLSYNDLFRRLNNQHSSRRYYETLECYKILEALSTIYQYKINNPEFFTTARSLLRNVRGYPVGAVILALGRVAPDQWNTFASSVNELTEGICGQDCDRAIKALGELTPQILFNENFMPTIKALTKGMNNRYNSVNRFYHDAHHLTRVLNYLKYVPATKIKLVLVQIQRLMQGTPGKIPLKTGDQAVDFIHQLCDCTSDLEAESLTNAWIDRVNRTPENGDDTHSNASLSSAQSDCEEEDAAGDMSGILAFATDLPHKSQDPEASHEYLKRIQATKLLEDQKRRAHGKQRKNLSKAASHQLLIAQEALRYAKAHNKKQAQALRSQRRGLSQPMSQNLELR